jgi:3-oxoacyl-[acyl-carrier-protein] synthase III
MAYKTYINGMACISAQRTSENDFLSSLVELSGKTVYRIVPPDYKATIPPAALRRMSSAVKNSIVASSMALAEIENQCLDAIIVGTGLGCIQDSEKFLNNLIDNQEQYLTPTSFIQSTHNTVAGQIAIGLQCKAYNMSYVNAGASFPSSLLDAQLFLKAGEKKQILVGGVDEVSDYTTFLFQLAGHYKKEQDLTEDILQKRTIGHVPCENAAFFVLETEKKVNSCAEIVAIDCANKTNDLPLFMARFLEKLNLNAGDIDGLMLGNAGDSSSDYFYDEAENFFPSATCFYFKHLFGESMTSSSIATWLSAKILHEQHLPKVLIKNGTQLSRKINNILIYNHYRGKDHSLIFLKNV